MLKLNVAVNSQIAMLIHVKTSVNVNIGLSVNVSGRSRPPHKNNLEDGLIKALVMWPLRVETWIIHVGLVGKVWFWMRFFIMVD